MMRMFKCKRIARTIPLYAAGDLAGASDREVTAHLATCEACRRLAEEFSREFSLSSSLLAQACTPPVFGADFYSGIRRSVLGQITRERMVSKPAFFRRRWLYATAFAALVVAFGLMLQHFGSSKRQPPRGLAIAPQVTDQTPSGRDKGTRFSISQSSELPHSTRNERRVAGPRRVQANGIRALANIGRIRKSDAATVKRDEPAQFALVIPSVVADRVIAPALANSSGELPSASSARSSASQLSRIEIQTANPNIRIIWLAPRESRTREEVNHDQDQNENGDRN